MKLFLSDANLLIRRFERSDSLRERTTERAYDHSCPIVRRENFAIDQPVAELLENHIANIREMKGLVVERGRFLQYLHYYRPASPATYACFGTGILLNRTRESAF